MTLLKPWSVAVWSSVLVIHGFHTSGVLVSAASDDTAYCFSSRDCVTGEFCEPGFGFCMPCSYICTGVGAARSNCVKFGCTGKRAFCLCIFKNCLMVNRIMQSFSGLFVNTFEQRSFRYNHSDPGFKSIS